MCQIVQNERELIKNVPKCVDSQQYLNYIKIQKTCLNLQDPPKSEKCIKIRQTYWNAPNCKEIQQIYQIGKNDSEQAKMLHHVTKCGKCTKIC